LAQYAGFHFPDELRLPAVIAPLGEVAIFGGLFHLLPGMHHDNMAAGTFDVRDFSFDYSVGW
jgi:hypothetical protein